MGASGSVASPSRLSNDAVKTYAVPGGGEHGSVVSPFGAVTRDNPPPLGAHPWDTGAEADTYYQVDKGFRFANTAGITYGQIPVQYNPALSRTMDGGPPAEPLSFDSKTYPNASYRREFHGWAQRFPRGGAAPGRGMWKYNNPFYPDNLPSQVTAGQAPPGQGVAQRGQGGVITPFVVQGGRGMVQPHAARQTRLAPAISYSSTTQVLGGSVFNDAALSGG